MSEWRASNARLRFAKVVEAAVAGEPQFVQRRDGKEVVVVSREYYEKTKPTLKSFLLGDGYSGEGEAAFDAALREVRATGPDILTRRSALRNV